MWVRRNDHMKMYSATGAEIATIPIGGFAFSGDVRVFGAKSVSFVFRGASGGPLYLADFIVSHAEIPVFPDNTMWAQTNETGCGMGYATSGLGSVSNYGGIHVSGFPLSTGTTPAPGSCITARWARLRLLNSTTAQNPAATEVPIVSVDSSVIFEGESCPKISTGSGYTTRSRKMTLNCTAGANNDYFALATGTLTGMRVGSIVRYQSGLPVVPGGGPIYVVQVYDTGVTAGSYFRVSANPNSTNYLLMPTTYTSKSVEIDNLELIADADRL